MHYSVLVIWDNPESILEPFQENNMWDCPKEYLEFEIEVSKEDFEKMSDEEKEETKDDYEEHEWAYWYWSNPNSIWDWYEIWGRWAWMLLLKDTAKKEDYPDVNFSWGWSKEDAEEVLQWNFVDQAKVKDIDWEWMRKEKIDKLVKQFNDVKELFNWEIPKIERSEESFIEEFWKDIGHEKFIEQDSIKKYLEVYMENFKSEKRVFWFRDKLEQYQFETAEEYAEANCNDWFSTYYVVSEDLWAITSDSHFDSTWEINTEELSFYDRFIKDLDPETLITIVDCHS